MLSRGAGPARREEISVATVDECERVLHRLAAKLRGPTGSGMRSRIVNRSVSCHLTDLDVTFTGTLRDGGLHDISRTSRAPDSAGRPAQIRLTMTSDDLVALAGGSLNLMSAWVSGRVGIRASVADLLRLRAML